MLIVKHLLVEMAAEAMEIEEEVLSKLPQLNLDQLGHVYGELNLPEIVDAARRTKKTILE